MKIYDLLCEDGHRFEGWFNSAEDFANQERRGLLSCPSCGIAGIRRVPSASRVNLGAQAPASAPAQASGEPAVAGAEGKDAFAIAQMLYSRMVDELLSKSEDVGSEFPAEARRIHYEQAPGRSIRGQATQAEHDALVEEGIPVARLPIPPSGRWN